MNQFIVLDDGRREIPIAKGDQRGNFGASALFVFSPNFRELITLYGSRFDNRKVPSGGIEEGDFPRASSKIHEAAEFAALRELEEETRVKRADLMHVAKASIEDTIHGDMRRYYFVAVAKKRISVVPFRSQEEGKEHYVDHQRWEPIEMVMRGASHDGERYNTLYAIALVRILLEMKEEGFGNDPEFRDAMIGLAYAGIDPDKQLVLLEERRAYEDEERRKWRFRN